MHEQFIAQTHVAIKDNPARVSIPDIAVQTQILLPQEEPSAKPWQLPTFSRRGLLVAYLTAAYDLSQDLSEVLLTDIKAVSEHLAITHSAQKVVQVLEQGKSTKTVSHEQSLSLNTYETPYGDLILDSERNQAYSPLLNNNRAIHLTTAEAAILTQLIKNPHRAISERDIYLWQQDPDLSQTMKAHIRHLREKLGEATDPEKRKLIYTFTRKGYSLSKELDLSDPLIITEMTRRRGEPAKVEEMPQFTEQQLDAVLEFNLGNGQFLRFFPNARIAFSPTHPNQPISLSITQARILEILMRNPKQVLSPNHIANAFDFDRAETLDPKAHIHALRKRLEGKERNKFGNIIHTIPGVGYSLSNPKALRAT